MKLVIDTIAVEKKPGTHSVWLIKFSGKHGELTVSGTLEEDYRPDDMAHAETLIHAYLTKNNMATAQKKMTSKLKYVYFVSFNLMTDKGLIVGNTACSLPEPITTIEHIRAIENDLNIQYAAPANCVSVVNFVFINTISY